MSLAELNEQLETELLRQYDERPGAQYPETIPKINELTLAQFFGWTLDYIRLLTVTDFGNALAFVSGTNRAKGPKDVVWDD